MTLKEFFAKARRNRKWQVTPKNGYVRCAQGYCPLGAVANSPYTKVPEVGAAARLTGLPVRSALKIAFAADDRGDENRRWLLKNLGVRDL